MKVRSTLDIAHTGTLGADDRIQFGMHQASTPFLMSLFIDLYSKKELAVIREYSTNAYDSHVAAGISDPIEIFLPTHFNAVFVVKDHGVGMTAVDIKENFSQYGWSSKRDNDDEVGMLGLGCKSGLTYTSQFTFVAVKDGFKTTVLVTRDEEGCGALQVIEEIPTDEPNGVEVQIPVRGEVSEFVDEVKRFFWFWPAGSVLIDGEVPEQQWATDLSDDIVIDDDVILSSGLPHDYIVMGNVPYPAGSKLSSSIGGGYYAAVRVPVGAVDFTPSREALHHTDRTDETVEAAAEFIRKNVHRIAQEAIDACTTHPEAWDEAERWRLVLPFNVTFTYKGDDIPRQFHDPAGAELWSWADNGYGYSDKWNRAIKQWTVRMPELRRAINVIGRKGTGLPIAIKHAINKWRRDNDISEKLVVCTVEPIGLPWCEPVTVEWSELRVIARDEGYSTAGKKAETFKVLGYNGKAAIVKSLKHHGAKHGDPRRGRVVWLESGKKDFDRRALVQKLGSGVLVVLVDKNQQKRFVAEHPDVLHVRQYATLLAARVAHRVTSLDMWRIEHSWDWQHAGFGYLNPDDILDPELADLIRHLGKPEAGADPVGERISRVRWLGNIFGVNLHLPTPSDAGERIALMEERYPLVDSDVSYRDDSKTAALEYINAVYLYRQSKGTP